MKTFILVALIFAPASSAHAVTRTWTGNGSDNFWSTAANWSPSGAPQNGDDLVFPGQANRLSSVNNLAGRRFISLLFNGMIGFGEPGDTLTISGSPIVISNGVSAAHQNGLVRIQLNLILAQNQAFDVTVHRLNLEGDVNLNGHNLLLFPALDSAFMTFYGFIHGTGDLTKVGLGMSSFVGVTGNTYEGSMSVNQGTLLLGKTNSTAIPGPLTIGRPTSVAVVRLLNSHQIADMAPITIESGSQLLLNVYDEAIGPLTMHGGYIISSTGALGLLQDITTPSGISSIRGKAVLYGVRTFDTIGRLEIRADLYGLGGILKEGPGILDLYGSNTFTARVTVNHGPLFAYSDSAFGATSGGVTLNGNNVSLGLFSANVGNEALTLNEATDIFFSGPCSWAGPISLNFTNAQATFETDSGGFIGGTVLSGPITGAGGITFLGNNFGGTFRLSGSGNNSYTGTTRAVCRELMLGKTGGARPFSGPLEIGNFGPTNEVRWLSSYQIIGAEVEIRSRGLMNLNGFFEDIGPLTIDGGGRIETGAGELGIYQPVTVMALSLPAIINGRLGLPPGSHSFTVFDGSAANDLEINAVVLGAGSLIKNGTGTLRLSGANTFGGSVIVNSGILSAEHSTALGTIASGTVVSNGATLRLDGGASLISEPLVLNGSGFGGTHGALDFDFGAIQAGNVTLASASTIRVDAPSGSMMSGVISGAGPFTKTGTGNLQIGGGSGSGNTYVGNTFVRAGTVVLFKPIAITAIPGNLIISDAVVRNFNSYQVIGNITVGAGGLLDINGHTENVDILNLDSGGDVRTGNGVLILKTGGAINVDPNDLGFPSSDDASISGTVDVLPGNLPIYVGRSFAMGRSAPELSITAAILSSSGIGNLHKNGPGEMHLSGANTFTGALHINDGTVTAAHSSALGTTQGLTDVKTNGTLVLEGGITVGDFLILESDVAVALSSVGGSNTVNAGINLLRPSCGVEVSSGGYLQVLGRVGSSGGLTKLGPGTLQFRGSTSNDYAGLTVVSSGVIECGRVSRISIPGDAIIGDDSTATTTATIRSLREQQFKRTADFTINRSGLLDLLPFPSMPVPQATLRRVMGAGKINLGAGTSLTISNDVSFDFSGSVSGGGALNKYALTTTMHMTGNSPFTGPTTIFQGRYRIDGDAPNSPVTVKPDGSLRGDGWVGNLTVEADGTVLPASEVPGHLGADLQMASANFLAGGILGLALYGPHPTGGNDSLLVNGPVTLAGTRLSSGFQYAPREGDVITLIRKTTAGPVSGTFNGFPEGALRFLGEIPVVTSYTGGDGNDVTLTVTNLALGFAGYQITSGNGNGLVEPDECNLIHVALQNRRSTSVSVTSAVLRSVTPDAVVTMAHAAYPSFSAGSIRTNITPFQLRTTPSLPCNTPVALELHVSVPGEGTFAIPFAVVAGTNCTPSGGGCESCTIVAGRFTTNSLLTIRVPPPVGAPSECLPSKPCLDGLNLSNAVRYVAHSFTNTTGADACINAQLHYDCPTAPVGALIIAAFFDTFVQHAGCANFLGDAGALLPDNYQPFSFTVPAGARFEVVVMQLIEVVECSTYRFELFGLPCPPPSLHIARDENLSNVLLQWSTAYPDWHLQTANDLSSAPGPFEDLGAIPVILDSKYTVTNAAAQPVGFYRLAK